jgi:hypothetical protein
MPPLAYTYKKLGWAGRPWHALEVTGTLAMLLVLLQITVEWVYATSIVSRPVLYGMLVIPITAAATLWFSLAPGFLMDLRKSPWLPKGSRYYLAAAVIVPLLFLEFSVLTVLSSDSWLITLVQTTVVSIVITIAVRSEWRSIPAKPATDSKGTVPLSATDSP